MLLAGIAIGYTARHLQVEEARRRVRIAAIKSWIIDRLS